MYSKQTVEAGSWGSHLECLDPQGFEQDFSYSWTCPTPWKINLWICIWLPQTTTPGFIAPKSPSLTKLHQAPQRALHSLILYSSCWVEVFQRILLYQVNKNLLPGDPNCLHLMSKIPACLHTLDLLSAIFLPLSPLSWLTISPSCVSYIHGWAQVYGKVSIPYCSKANKMSFWF